MTFGLNDEQGSMFEMAYQFGQQHIAPQALQGEKEETIPREMLTECGKLGFVGISVSEMYGGSGYLEGYGIDKTVLDLRGHQILEGTNEITRLITARLL